MNIRVAIFMCFSMAILAMPQGKFNLPEKTNQPSNNDEMNGYKIKFESEDTSMDQGNQNLFGALLFPTANGNNMRTFVNSTGVDLKDIFPIPKDTNIMEYIDNGMVVLGKLRDDTLRGILKPLQYLKNEQIAVPKTTVYVELLPEKSYGGRNSKTEN